MKDSKGFAALQTLKNEFEIQREAEELRWSEEMNRRYDELMQKRGFHSAEEMIDYLMSGKKLLIGPDNHFNLLTVQLNLFMKFMMRVQDLRVLGNNIKHLHSLRNLFTEHLTKIKMVSGCLFGLRKKSTNFN